MAAAFSTLHLQDFHQRPFRIPPRYGSESEFPSPERAERYAGGRTGADQYSRTGRPPGVEPKDRESGPADAGLARWIRKPAGGRGTAPVEVGSDRQHLAQSCGFTEG